MNKDSQHNERSRAAAADTAGKKQYPGVTFSPPAIRRSPGEPLQSALPSAAERFAGRPIAAVIQAYSNKSKDIYRKKIKSGTVPGVESKDGLMFLVDDLLFINGIVTLHPSMKATDFNIPEGNLVGYRFPNKLQKDCGLAAYNMIIRFADDELTDKETISDKKIAGESENIGFKTNMNERLKKNNTPVEELDKSGLKENLQPSPIFVRALNIPGEDAAADPDVGQALVIVGDPTTDEFMKKDYQFHYGAVIAKSSSDIVTIEMFGSEGGSQSTNFVINMYSVGDAEGNSFHTHWKKNYFTGGAPATYIVGWL